MNTLPLEISTQNLNTEALNFSSPCNAKIHEARVAARESFLSATRNAKSFAEGKVFSGYATSLFQKQGVDESKLVAGKLRDSGFDTLVVLGIGGSSLGGKCLYEALRKPDQTHRLIFLENIDPLAFDLVIRSLEWSKTAFALITKSGGTIETLAQFSQVLKFLKANVGDQWKKHLVAITDPKAGDLRRWAQAEQITTLEVPPEIGGRFSVFTPVGIMPLAFAGFDVDKLVNGACDMFAGKIISLEKLEDLTLRLMDLYTQGNDTHVIMPYATSLKPLGEWCVQLIGESLGKKSGPQKRDAWIPIAALGATDQHSLLQLLMEGPNKFVTHFVEVKSWPKRCSEYTFETLPAEFTSLRFAYEKSFDEIINLELAATSSALENEGRANFKITLAELSESSVGALIAFYMDLVSLAGVYLKVNPYDQPGVELGKTILKSISQTNHNA